MVLSYPVACITNGEVAHRAGALAVVVDGFAPLGRVAVGEVVFGKLLEVIAVRPEVVINRIENDADADAVRAVNETAEIIRLAIQMRRRIPVNAVVAPAEAARKL